jgi:hypothetical protein
VVFCSKRANSLLWGGRPTEPDGSKSVSGERQEKISTLALITLATDSRPDEPMFAIIHSTTIPYRLGGNAAYLSPTIAFSHELNRGSETSTQPYDYRLFMQACF